MKFRREINGRTIFDQRPNEHRLEKNIHETKTYIDQSPP